MLELLEGIRFSQRALINEQQEQRRLIDTLLAGQGQPSNGATAGSGAQPGAGSLVMDRLPLSSEEQVDTFEAELRDAVFRENLVSCNTGEC